MNTKLTLSLEKKVIEDAKMYAKGTGRSLSEMVENYFKSLVAKSNKDNSAVSYTHLTLPTKRIV